jgi:hypothetical protein
VTAPIDADAFSSAIIQSSEQTLLNYIQGLINDAILLSASNVQTAANTACVRGTGLGTGEGGLFVGGVTDAAAVKGSANAAGNGYGGKFYGAGSGNGVYGLGGPTGTGVYGVGGSAGGEGGNFGAQAGDGSGVICLGNGLGVGAKTTGGATGHGLWSVAGGSTAHAIKTTGAIQQTRTAPAYGASVAINAALGNEFSVTVTNGTAFTVANPTNGMTGDRLTIRIRNASGGATGVISWDTLYKLATFTAPANGFSRAIDFTFDGTNWVETSKTAADVPN